MQAELAADEVGVQGVEAKGSVSRVAGASSMPQLTSRHEIIGQGSLVLIPAVNVERSSCASILAS